MPVVLPLLAFVFLTAGFYRRNNGWRESLLFASIPWAVFLVLLTEILTQFRFLTRAGVAFSWVGFAIVCLVWMRRARRTERLTLDTDQETAPLRWMEWAGLGAIFLLLALTGLTAVVSAPNNWDAMEYHMPRVVEWISQHGVQFFPTIDWFQLDQPPFAEYTIFHLNLLYGSDRLSAMVQWLAYAGCIVGSSLVARELGGSRRSQLVTAVLAASIPSAVLGASSTKNDCVLAYWIVLTVYQLLRWRNHQGWLQSLAIGATLGLAALTKGTAYLLLPCIVVTCFLLLDRMGRRRFVAYLPMMAAIGILIGAPFWVRTYRYSGSPLGIPYFRGAGSAEQRMFRNTHFSPPQIAADVVRTLALNAGLPSDRINAISTRGFSRVMWTMGVNPNEPGQISWRQNGHALAFKVNFDPRDEFFAQDSPPLLLFLLAGVLWAVYCRKTGRELGWFGLGLVGAFLMFCALLRWAPTNERYLVPLIFLGSAFTAVVLVRTLPKWAVDTCVGLSILLALPLALANEARPLLTRHGFQGSIVATPRNDTYFLDRHRFLADSYIAAATSARSSGCREIGLDANLQHFEYPMMAMLTEDGIVRHIRYVGVENSTTQYADSAAPPVCMVVCLNCRNAPGKIAEYSADLPEVQTYGDIVLFRRQAQ